MIEVIHSPDNDYPIKGYIKSTCPQKAYFELQDFCFSKRLRGYSLRYSRDLQKGIVYFSHRNSGMFHAAVRFFESKGYKVHR